MSLSLSLSVSLLCFQVLVDTLLLPGPGYADLLARFLEVICQMSEALHCSFKALQGLPLFPSSFPFFSDSGKASH